MTFRNAPKPVQRALCRAAAALILVLVIASCTGTSDGATPRPTLTLIPATATPTHTPLPPTPEPNLTPTEVQLLASTLAAPTATPPGGAPGSALAVDDPIAAELILIAQRVVATELDLPVRRVRLVSYESYQWTDSSLGCPQEDQVYAPVISDGYRIVLEVGDTEYFFHTDFDRVLPCPAGSELLPDPEATEPASMPDVTPTPTPMLVG